MSIHPESGNLLAFATVDDHVQLKAALEKLDQSPDLDNTPQLQVYRLSEADPQSALNLLQNLVPKAQITVDAEHDVLVAIARLSDQAVIKAALDELESVLPAEKPRFDVYDVGNADTERLLTSLQPVVPDARLTVDAKTESLFAWCTESEHAMLADVLAKLLPSGLDSEEPVLRVYPFPYVAQPSSTTRTKPSKSRPTELPASLVTTLQQVAPEAQITVDSLNERLLVMASPADHMQIAGALAQLETTPPVEPQLRLATYQLQSADIEAVETMIESLFPDCRMVVDKRTNRLSVWADADDQQAIGEAVEQMDTGVPVEWQEKVIVYPMSKADPTIAIGILQELLPDVKLQADITAGTIVAWARAEDHETIRQVVEQMQRAATPDAQGELMGHPVGSTDADTVLSIMENLFPDIEFVLDKKTMRLLVRADAERQLAIQAALEQIDAGTQRDSQQTITAYSIKDVDATVALQLLEELLPGVKLLHDTSGEAIIAFARESDHQLIATTLKQMQVPEDEQSKPRLAVYPLQYTDVDTVSDVLRDVVPDAEVTEDEREDRLIVMASPADHTVIEGVIEQMDVENPADAATTVMVHEIEAGGSHSTAYYMMRLLREVVPQASMTIGSNANQLIVWATPEDHAAIGGVIEKLNGDGSPENAPKVAVYTLKYTDVDTVEHVLRDAVPEAEVTEDEEANKLIVWARPDDHAVIAEVLKQLDVEGLSDDASTVVVYTLTSTTAETAIGVLANVVPEAVFNTADDPKQLIAWARPTDHEKIKATVASLATPEEATAAVIYMLEHVDVDTVQEVLAEALPDAQLTADDEANRLIAWARPADQTVIAEVIKQMDVEDPADAAATVMVHEIEAGGSRMTAYYMMRLLREVVPQATMTLGSDANQLIVWASPEDHTAIGGVIEKLNGDGSPETAPKVVVYPLQYADVDTVSDVLRDAVPDAEVTEDEETNRLIAWARPDDHVVIADIVKQMDVESSAAGAAKAVVYSLTYADVDTVSNVLRDAVPEAEVTEDEDANKLIAWARPDDHAVIEAVIKQMDVEDLPDVASTVVVYELTSATAATAVTVLTDVVPEAVLNAGDDPHQLIAWARAADHEIIQAAVDRLSAPETSPEAAVHTFETISAAGAVVVLQAAFPEATFTTDEDPQKLIVLARPTDHPLIEKIITQIDVPEDPATAATVMVHTLPSADIRTAIYSIRLLREATPDATFTLGGDPSQLVTWARPADHEVIRVLIEKLASKGPPELAPKVVVYALKYASVDIVENAIRDAVPEVEVTNDEDANKLIVWAVPDEHKTIAQIVGQIDVEAPADSAPTAAVYTLATSSSTAAGYMIQLLQDAVPEASFTLGSDASQMIAWARPTGHEVIAEVLAKLSEKGPPELMPTMVAYALKYASVDIVQNAVTDAVPEVQVTDDEETNKLIVWARPDEHKIVQQILEQIDVEAPVESALTAVVYTFESASPAGALEILQTAVPKGTFAVDEDDPRRLIALARAAEQVIVAEIVSRIDVELPPGSKPTAAIYTLSSSDVRRTLYVIRLLQEAAPEATFTVGSDLSQIIAWAKPSDHEMLGSIVEKLTEKAPAETLPRLVTYRLPSTGAAGAIAILAGVLPGAQLTVGSDPSQLIVYARPGDHETIKAAVEQIEAEGFADANRTLAVYPMKSEDAASLLDVLEPSLIEGAKIVADASRDSVLVWADPERQAAIKAVIEQFLEELPEMIEPASRVYRLRRADPVAAHAVLSVLVPEAEIALDQFNRSLVVGALPEEHEKIQAMIDEMDREDALRDPQLKVHMLTSADPVNMLATLQALFADRPEVQLSLDEQNGAVIAVATPDEQQTIGQLIQQVEEGVLADADAEFKLYSLKDVDSYVLMEVLSSLAEKQGAKIKLTLDNMSNQLIAIARPEHHALIAQTIEDLRTEERSLEIFQLDYTEPRTAILAISSLFRDDGAISPFINSDEETGQLFVRATNDQLTRIRQLLVRMGETKLGSMQLGSGSRLRVIPIQGDPKALLEELRRIWPQLRGNPIQVQQKDPESTSPESSVQEKPNVEGPNGPDGPVGQSGSETPQEETGEEALPPIVVMLGEASITAASEDPAALDQFEALLHSLAGRTGIVGRYFSIFKIEHTGAAEIAATLTALFRTSSTESNGSSRYQPYGGSYRAADTNRVVIVPDERLNTILVQGSRSNRAKVEDLLEVLDVPGGLANKPQFIRIENTDASRVAAVVREMFASRLASSSSTSTSRSGTTLSRIRPQLIVDELSNSLIVMAPSPLVDDIKEFAQSLDESAAEEPARGIRIISLKKAGADRVEEVLGAILGRGVGRGVSNGASGRP
ncbi:MAG: secretin N-terminal domain-containing protein [Thermoguttaceae bacterium]